MTLQKLFGDNIEIQRTINLSKNLIEKLVPKGLYCYDKNGCCPFWDKFDQYPEQSNGYCSLLQRGDFMHGKDATLLLWDRCKECGINKDYDETDLNNPSAIVKSL